MQGSNRIEFREINPNEIFFDKSPNYRDNDDGERARQIDALILTLVNADGTPNPDRLINPPTVTPFIDAPEGQTGKGGYLVGAGKTRAMAALKAGFTQMWVRVVPTLEQLSSEQLTENATRWPVNPWVEMQHIANLIEKGTVKTALDLVSVTGQPEAVCQRRLLFAKAYDGAKAQSALSKHFKEIFDKTAREKAFTKFEENMRGVSYRQFEIIATVKDPKEFIEAILDASEHQTSPRELLRRLTPATTPLSGACFSIDEPWNPIGDPATAARIIQANACVNCKHNTATGLLAGLEEPSCDLPSCFSARYFVTQFRKIPLNTDIARITVNRDGTPPCVVVFAQSKTIEYPYYDRWSLHTTSKEQGGKPTFEVSGKGGGLIYTMTPDEQKKAEKGKATKKTAPGSDPVRKPEEAAKERLEGRRLIWIAKHIQEWRGDRKNEEDTVMKVQPKVDCTKLSVEHLIALTFAFGYPEGSLNTAIHAQEYVSEDKKQAAGVEIEIRKTVLRHAWFVFLFSFINNWAQPNQRNVGQLTAALALFGWDYKDLEAEAAKALPAKVKKG